jgi:hypothetical protein
MVMKGLNSTCIFFIQHDLDMVRIYKSKSKKTIPVTGHGNL